MIFYYFLPCVTPEQVREGQFFRQGVLEQYGLDGVLGDVRKVPEHASVSGVRAAVGPGQQVGTVITPVSKARGVCDLVGNDPARQKWTAGPLDRATGQPKYWVGYLLAEPPMPQDLERWEIVPGYLVTDPKGWQWKIPTARAPGQPYGFLPQSYTFDAAGEPQPHLEPNFVWLWELVGAVRDWYVRQSPGEDATPAQRAAHEPPQQAELVKYAARLLAVNYRVGLLELSLLHSLGRPALTSVTVHAICQAAYGWDVEQEVAKKKPEGVLPPAQSSSP